MTDTVLAMMLMVAMLLLGAALLAIALLYRGFKRTREQITDLRAQVAAQQIAALTGGGPASGDGGDGNASEPEPVRRKGHLSLYKGGGVVAAFAALAESLRIFGRRHRVITVTAGATMATAGAAAAILLTGTGEAADHLPETTRAAPEPTAMKEAGPDTAPGEEEALPGDPLADRNGGQGGNAEAHQEAAPNYRSLALVPGPRVGEPIPTGMATPLGPPAETPGAPAPDTPAGEVEPPTTPAPGEEPAPEPPAAEEPEDEGILCFHTGRLLDLCLLEPAQ
ncbi:membrane protein [Streptomyces phage TurkishDelight]|uniref:Membrane protein n=1 Tax=Streptomyces phage TurkishDelight TaxID=2793708 RepID=A0A7T0M1V6_9CAUD|nr:membrane protein [Streptomyces phage TurkishDelight]QPL14082.1 membrane protein [Streptomyces phage TurkishDelight]